MHNKDFEKELEDFLAEHAPSHNIHFHRLPDSYSARGRTTVPAQPADFQVVLPGGIHFYIEVKEAGSQNDHKFKMWKLSDSQWAAMGDSVDYGFNFLSLNMQRVDDQMYLVPSWLLIKCYEANDSKTIDLKELAKDHEFIVLNNKEEIFDKLLNEQNLRARWT